MSKFESVAELYDKLDWEGGFPDIIWGYGISWRDLPDGTPQHIIDIWRVLEAMDRDIRVVQGWLEDNQDNGRYEEDQWTNAHP